MKHELTMSPSGRMNEFKIIINKNSKKYLIIFIFYLLKT